MLVSHTTSINLSLFYMHHFLDTPSLKQWFSREKRELPWRQFPTPYQVWISEVMLQQTQAAVVIPYFEKWMEQFPSIESLAEAALDQVIKAWEGLGYYSRARNLHAGARYIVQHLGGRLPQDPEELSKIKGLGPYTIGAIRSFAFHHKAAAVDANVIRVLCRYFLLEEDIAKPKTVQHIRQIAETILPEEEPWVVAEALIELGATVCTRNPQCRRCPLRASCAALLHGKADKLPYKSRKITIQALFRGVAIVHSAGHLLVKRGVQGSIMSDLHEFPYLEGEQQQIADPAACGELLSRHIEDELGLRVEFDQVLPAEAQAFTRYRVTLQPSLYTCYAMPPVEGCQWLSIAALQQLAFSSGHRRIFQSIVGILAKGARPCV